MPNAEKTVVPIDQLADETKLAVLFEADTKPSPPGSKRYFRSGQLQADLQQILADLALVKAALKI